MIPKHLRCIPILTTPAVKTAATDVSQSADEQDPPEFCTRTLSKTITLSIDNSPPYNKCGETFEDGAENAVTIVAHLVHP